MVSTNNLSAGQLLTENSGVMLNCNIHECPSKCHQLHDHSKMKCEKLLEWKCLKGHKATYKCFEKQPGTCRTCAKAQAKKDAQLKLELELQEKRAKDQARHDAEIAELDEDIKREQAVVADKQASDERRIVLERKKKELEMARKNALRASAQVPDTTPVAQSLAISASQSQVSNTISASQSQVPNTVAPSGPTTVPSKGQSVSTLSAPTPLPAATSALPLLQSKSEQEWARQKRVEGADNEAMDELMAMTGLEDVKEQFLTIKARLDTCLRQRTDLRKERYGMTFCGNPGTGTFSSPSTGVAC
jgi:hypothetical protein